MYQNIYKIHSVISIFFVLMIFSLSCEKVGDQEQISIEKNSTNDGMMILGNKIPNAYTVENMTQAYQNLIQASKKGVIDLDIPLMPTHYYIRFLPRTEYELYQLQKDTTLILFDFPMDFEIVGNGTYYHDPSLPDTAITWQYCTVEANFNFPDIEYELLEELFLPGTNNDQTRLKVAGEWTFWDELEREALRIKGLLNENELKSVSGTKFKPSGEIKIYDNSGLGTFGLEGVEVIATRGFTSKSEVTDSAGKFLIDHEFGGPVTYKIKWERDDYDIRSGTYGQAYFNGPEQEEAWNHTFSVRDISWCYAHIHRAAYNYYYNNAEYGIQSPPRQGGILNQRLHIGAMDKDGTSHYYDFNSFIFAAQVKIYCKYASGTYRSSVNLFGTTTHELAHALHWDLGYSTAQYLVDLIFSNAVMPESWAECVEHVITSDAYKRSTISAYRNWNNNQDITLSDPTRYTALFIDLIDNYNQQNYKGSLYPVDNVVGYSLSQLEYVLDKTYIDLSNYGLSTLEPIWETFAPSIYRSKLKSTYNNATEQYIDELFENYF
ncbi:MAG: hypothetical protein ACOYXB_17055 [Bacteroidota bacterium]